MINYLYDMLNRVTKKTPVGRPTSEIVTYTYDSNTLTACWRIGRLATMADASGTTRFGYDHRGNFTGKNIIGTTVLTVALQYDLADRIIQVRTVHFVSYTRDDKGRMIEARTRPNNTAAGPCWRSGSTLPRASTSGTSPMAMMPTTISRRSPIGDPVEQPWLRL